jgi:hypothetical protein
LGARQLTRGSPGKVLHGLVDHREHGLTVTVAAQASVTRHSSAVMSKGKKKGEAEMEMELHMGPAVGAKILR